MRIYCHSCELLKPFCSIDVFVSETALQNVSMFLRSEDRWRASALLPNIGE